MVLWLIFHRDPQQPSWGWLFTTETYISSFSIPGKKFVFLSSLPICVYSEMGSGEHICSHCAVWLILGNSVGLRRNNHPLQARCLWWPLLVKHILICSTFEMQTSHPVVKSLMSWCFDHSNSNNYSHGRKFWIQTWGRERDNVGTREAEGRNQINTGPWALLAKESVTWVVKTKKDWNNNLCFLDGGLSGSGKGSQLISSAFGL